MRTLLISTALTILYALVRVGQVWWRLRRQGRRLDLRRDIHFRLHKD